MGATEFSTVHFGKTAQEAFNAAKRQAQHDDGHSGYTGTIAEKDGFTYFETPKGVSFKAMVRWLVAACTGLDAESCTRDPFEDEQYKRQAARDAKRAWAKIPAAHRPLARRMATIHADKWGNAVCFKVTGSAAAGMRASMGYKGKRGDFYYFAGLASC